VHRPAFTGKRAIGTAATICAAVLVPLIALAALPSFSAGATVATPRCATSGLVVWLDTQGNGAAGSVYYHLKFTNLSGRACTLYGYPGVSAVDLAGRQLGSAASRNAAHRPNLVTLPSGATATAVLRIAEADNFPASRCRPVTAAGLRVYPPNQTAAKPIPFPFRACSHPGPVYMAVETTQKA
jgi:Protein of unknown function (DUF4232)